MRSAVRLVTRVGSSLGSISAECCVTRSRALRPTWVTSVKSLFTRASLFADFTALFVVVISRHVFWLFSLATSATVQHGYLAHKLLILFGRASTISTFVPGAGAFVVAAEAF